MKSCRPMTLLPRPRLRLALAIVLLAAIAASVALPSARAHGGSSEDDDADAAPGPGADRHHTNLRSKSLVLTKIWCLIIVFFATFLAGVSPYFCRWNRSFLVLGTQFAGGVFLGTALMHFLSDADSTFKDRSSKDYPFAFMLASAGYLLTMFGDCVIQWILRREKPSPKVDVETGHNYTGDGAQGLPVEDGSACKCEPTADVNLEAKNFVAATLVKTTSFGDTLLLIFALCFHSVFEGIAIGIAETEANAWRALWTISLHKIFAAIAMGIALLRLLPERPLLSTSLYSFAFGISSPVGVAIGIIIDATTEGAVADWMYAIAMGLACGVFIYVAINHLLAKGYVPDCKVAVDTPFWRFLAATLGVGVIAVVMIWD